MLMAGRPMKPLRSQEIVVEPGQAELDRRDRPARPAGIAQAGMDVFDDDVLGLDAREDLAHRREWLRRRRAARVTAAVNDGVERRLVEGAAAAALRRSVADALVVGPCMPSSTLDDRPVSVFR